MKSKAAKSRRSPARPCSARFLADFSHYVLLHVVETPDDARKIVPGFTDDMRACCEYDHSSEGDKKADLVFLRQHLDAPLIVHECVHAACNWTVSEEMTNAPENISEEEMQQHFEEVMARVVEQLCCDAFHDLLPNVPHDLSRTAGTKACSAGGVTAGSD